jgi:hypothetical protein
MEVTPIIRFDVNNPEHRKDFVSFRETKSLGKCKNRYTLEGNYGDVVSMMTDKIINYYIHKEFSTSK